MRENVQIEHSKQSSAVPSMRPRDNQQATSVQMLAGHQECRSEPQIKKTDMQVDKRVNTLFMM